MSDNITVVLVGTGEMAIEYARVLIAQNISFQVIGRGDRKAKLFEDSTGIVPLRGGVDNNLDKLSKKTTHAIVATGIPELADVTVALMEFGIRKVLVEKPGGLYKEDIERIKKVADREHADVYIAYNRRFFASTRKAMQIIKEDGGVSSFHFEFTEWSNEIENLATSDEIKQQWLYANSSHVIDLAFFLGGIPLEMKALAKGELSWHKNGAVYSGAGISECGALFSYQADWGSPGRWSVEIMTTKHRLYFKPMEELHVQNLDTVKIEKIEIDDDLDRRFKPGLYEEVKSFLFNQGDVSLKTIIEQINDWKTIECIENGN